MAFDCTSEFDGNYLFSSGTEMEYSRAQNNYKFFVFVVLMDWHFATTFYTCILSIMCTCMLTIQLCIIIYIVKLWFPV